MEQHILKALVDSGLSTRKIAIKTECSPTTVRHYLAKWGMATCADHSQTMKEVRKNNATSYEKKYNNVDWESVQKAIDAGDSWRDIVRKFKISNGTIRKAKINAIIKTRDHKTAMRLVDQGTKRTPEAREYARKVRTEYFQRYPEKHPNRLLANNRTKMSFPERLVFDYLKKEQIDFEHNAKIGPFWVDFLVGKIAIEVDGKRWHNEQRDAMRDKEIGMHGIVVIRFDAKEIIKQVDIVKQAVGKQGNPQVRGT